METREQLPPQSFQSIRQAVCPPQAVPLGADPLHCSSETVEVPFSQLNAMDQLRFLQMSRNDSFCSGNLADLLDSHNAPLTLLIA